MAITHFTDDVAIIAALADLPNATSGLTAAQFKAKFDIAAGLIKTYINSTLIAALEATTTGSSGAHQIGSAAITGVTGATVNAQIADLKTQLTGLVLGLIPDASISEAKLSFLIATQAELDAVAAIVTANTASITANTTRILNAKRIIFMGGMF